MDKYTIQDPNGSTSDFDEDEYAYANGNRANGNYSRREKPFDAAPVTEYGREPTGNTGHDGNGDAESEYTEHRHGKRDANP